MKQVLEFVHDNQIPTEILARPDLFDYLMQIDGQTYRAVATRQTLKVRLGARNYFIKRHRGVGWGEVFKNWMTFKRPVVSAHNEVEAIQALKDLHIPTTPYVGHGIRGCMPASLHSFVLTEDLGDIVTLEDVALTWQKQRPRLQYKRALIRRVAEIAGTLHAHGIYHRDFYICHFCFKREEDGQLPPPLYVLDLHRVEIHHPPSVRMQIKDLAALYFSAFSMHLTQRDVFCFLKFYQFELLRNHLPKSYFNEVTLKKISKRARSLRIKYEKKINQGKLL